MILTKLALFYHQHQIVVQKTTKIILIIFNLLWLIVLIPWLYILLSKQVPTIKDNSEPLKHLQINRAPKDLIVLEKVLLPKASGKFDAWLVLKNPNQRYHAQLVRYNLDLVDNQNWTHDRKSGQTYVLAGDSQTIVVSNLSSSQISQPRLNLDTKIVWLRNKLTPAPTELSFKLMSQRVEGSQASLRGVVINDYDQDFKEVKVKAGLKSGDILAAAETVLYDLAANSQREFGLNFLGQLNQSIEIIIKTEVNPF